jgi:hypothetical protein
MTKCRDIKEKLPAYFEGIVNPEDKRLIEEHLLSCEKCSVALEDLKKTQALVHNLEEVEPPPWLTQKVMSRVREETEQKIGIFQKLFYPLHIKLPIEAFATLLIVVLALFIYRATGPEMKALQTAQVIPKDSVVKEYEKAVSSPSAPSTPTLKGDISEAARLEEKPAPARPSEQQQIEKKREIVKENESIASQGTEIKETREHKAMSAAPQLKTVASKKPHIITITVKATNIAVAGKDVEDLLNKSNAQKIKCESLENMEVITAELASQKIKELFEKLKTIGEMKEKGTPSDLSEGNIIVRIEIVSNP